MRASMHLGSVPTSPGRARRFVANFLDNWAERNLRETALLLVSELVTNAVVHAQSEVRVNLTRPNESDDHSYVLRVEVHDSSQHLPSTDCLGAGTESGRGLVLVDALATRWGVTLEPNGKTVWFELRELTPLPNSEIASRALKASNNESL